MANFSSVLDTPVSTVEKPKPFPVGGLIVQIGQFKEVEIGKNKTPALDFESVIRDTMPDVDRSGHPDIIGKPYRLRFFLTEESKWRLRDFLENSLRISVEGKTFKQMLAEAPTRLCIVQNKHRAADDGSAIFNDQGQTAPMPG